MKTKEVAVAVVGIDVFHESDHRVISQFGDMKMF